MRKELVRREGGGMVRGTDVPASLNSKNRVDQSILEQALGAEEMMAYTSQ